MKKIKVIHWFRQDLRLSDNPALTEASTYSAVLPIYILDDVNSDDYKMGGASRLWLHHSLIALNKKLDGNLSVYCGDPLKIISNLCSCYSIQKIFWNRCYEPWRIARDTQIIEHFKSLGIEVGSYNGSLLWEPWNISKDDGTPYRVFAPFYRKGCTDAFFPRAPISEPKKVSFIKYASGSLRIEDLKLLPTIDWGKKIIKYWKFGEIAAHNCLMEFIESGISDYKEGRNYPAKNFVSRLSPYLHFGEISPNQVWYAIKKLGDNINTDHFCSELGWREFSYSLLYYNPELPQKNLQAKFNAFPWHKNNHKLLSWQKGLTGIPMVDAGMRELWETGYMHNRVRMIVGSFLVKNLLLDWRLGEQWFWDCLVDADLANNSTSWQWVAGSGADAAPYFRIFNPVSQGKKFDPNGKYIRRYIPELEHLPNRYLFSPWKAPNAVLDNAGVKLGVNYPTPIVDLSISRRQALDAFISLKLN